MYPQARRNKAIYLAGMDIVETAIIMPGIAHHHQAERWKNRSPVLSAMFFRISWAMHRYT